MKSTKITSICFFMISILFSSSFIFPMTFAQTAGTCKSVVKKEIINRPIVYYSTNAIITNTGDNRFHVYVYKPPEYEKEIKLKVSGISDWSLEELYPNTAKTDGNDIIVTTSTAFIIHGKGTKAECGCSSYDPNDQPYGHCSAGCENVFEKCTSNSDCRAKAGLTIIPYDNVVKSFPVGDSKTLVASFGILQNEAFQLVTSSDYNEMFSLMTASLFGIVTTQFNGMKTSLDVGQTVTLLKMQSDGSITNVEIGSFTDVLNHLHGNMFPRDVEGYAWFLTDFNDGRINTIVDLTEAPGIKAMKNYVDFDSEALTNYADYFFSIGKIVLGLDHGHPGSTSLHSLGDIAGHAAVLSNLFRSRYEPTLSKFKFWESRWLGNPNLYVMSYATELDSYTVSLVSGPKAWEAYKLLGELKDVDISMSWEQAVEYLGFNPTTIIGDTLTIRTITTPSDLSIKRVNYLLTETEFNYNQILGVFYDTFEMLRIGGDKDGLYSFIGDVETFRNSLPQNYMNSPVLIDLVERLDMLASQARSLVNMPVLSPQIREIMSTLRPKVLEPYYDIALDSTKTVVETSNFLESQGYSPSTDSVDTFRAYAISFEEKSKLVDEALESPSKRKVIGSLGGWENIKEYFLGNRWAPVISGIQIALMSSNFLKEFAGKLDDPYRTYAMAGLDTLQFSKAFGDISATAYENLCDKSLPQVAKALFGFGKGTELVNSFRSTSFVAVLSIVALDIYKCEYLNPDAPSCGCTPDPLYGSLQLELEKNPISKDEKTNFVLYGMEKCSSSDIGQVVVMNKRDENSWETDRSVGVNGLIGDCNFKSYSEGAYEITCCEGKIGRVTTASTGEREVKLEPKTYTILGNTIAHRTYGTHDYYTGTQSLTVGGTESKLNCIKESSTSWLCTSPENTITTCSQDNPNDPMSPWTCSIK